MEKRNLFSEHEIT